MSVRKVDLLEEAKACILLSEKLLFEGDQAGSLAHAMLAAQYLQLIRLLREEGAPR
jgi:hypothetical protein